MTQISNECLRQVANALSPRLAPSGSGSRAPRVRISHLLTGISAFVLAMLLIPALPAAAQSQGNPAYRSLDPSQINERYPDKTIFMTQDANTTEQEMKRIKLMNVARQRSMVQDAEKLLRLAQELNSNTAEGVPLTASQRAHKAEEIEKLARDVKDKMTFVYSPDMGPQTPLGSWPQ